MRKKFAGTIVGATMLIGGLAAGSTASAATDPLPSQLTAAQIAQLQSALRRLDTAQLLSMINQAIASDPERLGPVKTLVCANSSVIVQRAPARLRAQASALLAQLCAPTPPPTESSPG